MLCNAFCLICQGNSFKWEWKCECECWQFRLVILLNSMKKHCILLGGGHLCVTLRKCSCQLQTGWKGKTTGRQTERQTESICSIAWQLECENYWKNASKLWFSHWWKRMTNTCSEFVFLLLTYFMAYLFDLIRVAFYYVSNSFCKYFE